MKNTTKKRTLKICVAPRQTGKTTDIKMLFVNDLRQGKNSLIVTHNNAIARNIQQGIIQANPDINQAKVRANVGSAEAFANLCAHNIPGWEWPYTEDIYCIYVDEYFFLAASAKMGLWKYVTEKDEKVHLHAFGTADRVYKTDHIELATYINARLMDNPTWNYQILFSDFFNDEFCDLRYNLICHPDVEIVDKSRAHLRDVMTKEQYELEIIGTWRK